MSFTTVAKGIYKINYYLSPISSQSHMQEVVVSSIFGNKNWTVMLRSTDINSIEVKCPTEVEAGNPLPCTISARNAAEYFIWKRERSLWVFNFNFIESIGPCDQTQQFLRCS